MASVGYNKQIATMKCIHCGTNRFVSGTQQYRSSETAEHLCSNPPTDIRCEFITIKFLIEGNSFSDGLSSDISGATLRMISSDKTLIMSFYQTTGSSNVFTNETMKPLVTMKLQSILSIFISNRYLKEEVAARFKLGETT